MGLLDLLFGKKQKPGSTAPAKQQGGADSLSPESKNLMRWRESGEPRAWVEAHKGQWNHQEWLALLETLQRSSYWPMHPEEVGRVLEEIKAASASKASGS